jgi:hypothetical protein
MNYAVGMIVLHPNKPEWGAGKIVRISGSKLDVAFKNLPGWEVKKIETTVAQLMPVDDQQSHQFAIPDSIRSGLRRSAGGRARSFKGRIPKGWCAESMVVCLPATGAEGLVYDHGVYACPAAKTFLPTAYLAVRTRTGVMTAAYRKRDGAQIILSPDYFRADSQYGEFAYRDRIRNFITAGRGKGLFLPEPYRFYILNEEDRIDLPHQPTLRKVCYVHCYVSLADLTSGAALVDVASRRVATGA